MVTAALQKCTAIGPDQIKLLKSLANCFRPGDSNFDAYRKPLFHQLERLIPENFSVKDEDDWRELRNAIGMLAWDLYPPFLDRLDNELNLLDQHDARPVVTPVVTPVVAPAITPAHLFGARADEFLNAHSQAGAVFTAEDLDRLIEIDKFLNAARERPDPRSPGANELSKKLHERLKIHPALGKAPLLLAKLNELLSPIAFTTNPVLQKLGESKTQLIALNAVIVSLAGVKSACWWVVQQKLQLLLQQKNSSSSPQVIAKT